VSIRLLAGEEVGRGAYRLNLGVRPAARQARLAQLGTAAERIGAEPTIIQVLQHAWPRIGGGVRSAAGVGGWSGAPARICASGEFDAAITH